MAPTMVYDSLKKSHFFYFVLHLIFGEVRHFGSRLCFRLQARKDILSHCEPKISKHAKICI